MHCSIACIAAGVEHFVGLNPILQAVACMCCLSEQGGFFKVQLLGCLHWLVTLEPFYLCIMHLLAPLLDPLCIVWQTDQCCFVSLPSSKPAQPLTTGPQSGENNNC